MSSRPSALFCDCDGVLVMSEALHHQRWCRVLDYLGLPSDSLTLEESWGLSDLRMATLIALYHQKIDPEELLKMYQDVVRREPLRPPPPPPGRDEALLWVRPHLSVLGMVSAASHADIRALLGHDPILQLFDWIIAAEDVVEHKPSPEAYLEALDLAEVAPGDALVIEDSPTGVMAAVAAGIPTWQLLPGAGPSAPGVAQRFTSWQALLPALQQLMH